MTRRKTVTAPKGPPANRGLIQYSGICPTMEHEVAMLMQEGPTERLERADVCRRICVVAVAGIKAMLAETRAANKADHEGILATGAELRGMFAEMIDGSMFRAAWDLGDAPPMRIMGTVARGALGELVELKSDITSAQIEAQAAVLLLEVEQRHGVTHVDPRQGNLL